MQHDLFLQLLRQLYKLIFDVSEIGIILQPACFQIICPQQLQKE